MFGNTDRRNRWIQGRQLLILLSSVFTLLVLAFASSQALAGRLTDMPPQTQIGPNQSSLPNGSGQAVRSTQGASAVAPSVPGGGLPSSRPNIVDGFMFLTPDTVTLGNCPAPANGGTTL